MRIHSRGALSTGVVVVALVFAAAGYAVSNGAQAPATHNAAQAAAKANAVCAKAKTAAKAESKAVARAKAAVKAKSKTAAKAKAAANAASKAAARGKALCAKANAALDAARAAHAAPQTTTVTVSMFEMGFKLSATAVPRGTVVFKVVNDGKVPHDFRVGGKGTEYLDSGQNETLTVDFAKPGKFTFLCTVSGHAAAGMIGTLTVK